MSELPEPHEGAVFYEDGKVYACLANYPKTKGHSVVVWKEKIKDLHLLSEKDYLHLMDIVERVRDVILEILETEKVYLIYMDEAEHVHWHLVPRYVDEGVEVLEHDPGELEDFSLASKIEEKINRD